LSSSGSEFTGWFTRGGNHDVDAALEVPQVGGGFLVQLCF
jgi:hypothetical protein